MVLCIGLALAVILAVAVPARREGRDVLTSHGEQVVASVKERSESLASATRSRTARLASSVRHRVRPPAQAAAETGPARAESPPSSGTASA